MFPDSARSTVAVRSRKLISDHRSTTIPPDAAPAQRFPLTQPRVGGEPDQLGKLLVLLLLLPHRQRVALVGGKHLSPPPPHRGRLFDRLNLLDLETPDALRVIYPPLPA